MQGTNVRSIAWPQRNFRNYGGTSPREARFSEAQSTNYPDGAQPFAQHQLKLRRRPALSQTSGIIPLLFLAVGAAEFTTIRTAATTLDTPVPDDYAYRHNKDESPEGA